jgi:hypothetical protein
MSTEAINDLKRCVKQYRDVDNEIRVLNKTVYEKREARRIVQLEMADLARLPQFVAVDKLKIDDDGSYIRIQRPETYAKPWSLSKKELSDLHVAYFASTTTPTAEGCSAFIIENRKRGLIGKEFEFTRITTDDD